MLQKHIFLIGFMGCGKSRNGSRLAYMTGAKLMEMDQEIVNQQGMPIAEIFEKCGERYFRDLETELLKKLKDRNPMIISCGGGVVLRDENVRLMKEMGTIVLLTAEAETIYQRVRTSTARPILNGNMNLDYIRELMDKRQSKYEAAADVTIATDGKQSEDVCKEIMAMW